VKPVLLITGSRKGIGRFMAGHFLTRGHLVVGCSRNSGEIEHPDYEHFQADISQEQQVIDLLRHIRTRHGRLDGVINNAGIAAMNPVTLTPAQSALSIMATNFIGTFCVCRESVKLMIPRRFGRIVNFSTVAVPMCIEGEAIYASSKSAVETFTRVLAREVGSYGITVNAVGPGPIDTGLIQGVPKEKIEVLVERLAIKRLGKMEDVTNAVEFFLRPESEYITGQTLYLGGAS
jgi:3-oxoacyl-[acyl-carrier protein] reductase